MKKNISFFTFYPVRNPKGSMQFGVILPKKKYPSGISNRVYPLFFASLLITISVGCAGKTQLVKKDEQPVQEVSAPAKKTNPLEIKYHLAETLLEQGKDEEAIQILKDALQLQLNVENEYFEKIKLLIVETEIKLANKYFSLGEYEKTINHLKEVKEIDQKKYLVYALLEEKAYRLLAEKFVKQKNYPQAIKIYEEMVLIYPEKSRIYKEEIKKLIIEEKIDKAEGLFKKGEYQKASILYEEIFQETPKKRIKLRLSKIYFLLGETYYRKKDYPEAKKYWQKSIELVPGNLKILFLLAEIYREENNWQDAEKYYLQVIELDKEKKYSQVEVILGKWYQETKRYQEAKEYYEKYLSSCKEISNRAEIHQRLAQVLSYLGSYRQARENLLRAQELDPELRGNSLFGEYPLKFRIYCLLRNWQTYLYGSLSLIFLLFIYFFLRYKIPSSFVKKKVAT